MTKERIGKIGYRMQHAAYVLPNDKLDFAAATDIADLCTAAGDALLYTRLYVEQSQRVTQLSNQLNAIKAQKE